MTSREFLKLTCSIAGLSLLELDFSKVLNALPKEENHPALFWNPRDSKNVQCLLCPRKCLIQEGKRGFCRVRQNNGGSLYTLVYSKSVAMHVDPIEKKPLFHFLPGTTAFSFCTASCNLRCKFCQNWEISQSPPEDLEPININPEEIVSQAQIANSRTIAYTYTEPTVFYEYMLDTAKTAKKQGLKNIIHSAGFINEEPIRNLCKYIDAANIDLKGFTRQFYQDVCSGNLDDVLRTLKIIKDEKVHLEITNLIIPTLNDDLKQIEDMCVWIKENLGSGVPVHFSRFHPMYKLTNLGATPVKTLEAAQEAALKTGLKYVYIGNVPGHRGETTFCPNCKNPLIIRIGYAITENNLKSGCCGFCKEKIAGVWS